MNFDDYLRTAWHHVRQAAETGEDNGDLAYFNHLCRQGVGANWSALEPRCFLENYHRCIAAASRRVAVLEKFLPSQVELFRSHDAARIVSEQQTIWSEWREEKRFLNSRMVQAMITTSELIKDRWEEFKNEYLPLPENPETSSLEGWALAHKSLDRLPMVGEATAWYLLRNLYGAPVFKPDVHICAIAAHFFPDSKNPLRDMAEETCKLWGRVCDDKHYLPVHLGEVDYVLWWYRQYTGLPESNSVASCSC